MQFSEIINRLHKEFRRQKIPFIVSPYEADSQLAFLSTTEVSVPCALRDSLQYLELAAMVGKHRISNPPNPPANLHPFLKLMAAHESVTDCILSYLGDPPAAPLVDLVMSDDSDCVPTGCPRVFLKRDFKLNGRFYDRSTLGTLGDDFSLATFTEGMVACFCILAGCDYLANPSMVGIVTARRLVEEAFLGRGEDPPLKILFDRLRKHSCMKQLSLYEQEVSVCEGRNKKSSSRRFL